MGDKHSKADAKRAKKLSKAKIKSSKKSAIAEPGTATPGATSNPESQTPAERSASAAERSARINQRRFVVQIVAVVITLLTALIAWMNRGWLADRTESSPSTAPTSMPATP